MKNKNIFLVELFLMAFMQPIQASMTSVSPVATEQAVLTVKLKDANGAAWVPCSKSLQNCSVFAQQSSCTLSGGNTVTITNNSGAPALNIAASSSDSNFNTYVIQNNGCPASLSVGGSCTIAFFLNANALTNFVTPNVVVKGDNTNTTYFDLFAFPCQ